MPPKEKKTKKSKKAEEESAEDSELLAVDKQFYELTIADINKKLTRLRSHNVKIEEKNDELEIRMKHMEEDRQDVTAYLNRTLKEKVNIIQELEDKLTELSKVRDEENENFKKRMLEWENKFKANNDNLTSEIKLLTGKLQSMEEFRLQRDDLIAKFDTQEYELREQAKKHKAILYEMERKVILDKERMRKDVENKLLELSTEFTKTSDLRVAASTQRILRENIALNNDMDRILVMQSRLENENGEMKKKHKEIVSQYEASVAEKKRLIKTCEQQMDIIKQLTKEGENSRDLNAYLLDIKRSHEVARKMTKDNRSEMMELKEKVAALEQHIHVINGDRHELKREALFYKQESERISDIIKTVRLTIKSAIKGEGEEHDPAFQESRRSNLLGDLLNILNNLEQRGIKPSLETIPSLSNFYTQGDLGFLPKDEDDISSNGLQSPPQIHIEATHFLTPSIHSIMDVTSLDAAKSEKSELIDLIDPQSGTLSIISDKSGSTVFDDSEMDLEKTRPEPKSAVAEKSRTDRTSMMLSIDLRQSLEKHSSENEEIKDKESIFSEAEIEDEAAGEDEQ